MQNMLGHNLLIITIFAAITGALGQHQHNINYLEGLVCDGKIEDNIMNLESCEDFVQNFPSDSLPATSKTKVWTHFDDEFLYISAICYSESSDYSIQSLTRDFDLKSNDAFTVILSPMNDQTNGFYFAVTPYGTQHEGLIHSGGSRGGSGVWDNKWYSEVQQDEYGWSLEMKIPFKSIRYKTENKTWGINFARTDLTTNEISTWNKVPQNFDFLSLANTGSLIWSEPPPEAGTNISLIPYGIAGWNKDYGTNESKITANVGLDAKIAITSSLNLDLTLNPDFSQVDADVQITNLSRFSLFFPERRQFFLENSDLFDKFGFSSIRPFFSRKIGLSQGQTVSILGGARLSGSINKNWRIGLMNLLTEGSSLGPAENFTVGAVQRRVGNWGNLAFITVNKQQFASNNKPISGGFNRIFGLDYNLQSPDGKNRGKFFYHHSFSNGTQDKAHASWYMYNVRKFAFHWNHEYVGEDYRADVGFVPRVQNYNSETGEYVYKSYWRLEPSVTFRHYPKKGKINYIAPSIYFSEYYDENFVPTETKLSGNLSIKQDNQGLFKLSASYNQVRLLFDTDITFSGNTPHTAGFYSYNNVTAEYESSPAQLLYYRLKLNYGEYYTGHIFSSNATVSFRLQPRFKLSTSFEYNSIYFQEKYNDVQLLIVSPRVDFQLNKKMFFTTFVQYNTQVDNININARFQYRFKPMSDLFVVYTDNYDSNVFGIKNRALVIKLVWWLNV